MIEILKFIVVLLLLTLVVQLICAIILAVIAEVFLWYRKKKMWDAIIRNDPEISEGLERLRKKINERNSQNRP